MTWDEAKRRAAKKKSAVPASVTVQLTEPEPGRMPRPVVTKATEAAEIRSKLVELRELAQQGYITPAALAKFEEQGGRQLVELRESARPNTGVAMNDSTKALVERYVAVGLDVGTATELANGADPTRDAGLRARIDAAEGRQLRERAELGVSLGLSESASIDFAIGRSLMSRRRADELIEASSEVDLGEAGDDDEAEIEKIEKRLAESFVRGGMGESEARVAARGRR